MFGGRVRATRQSDVAQYGLDDNPALAMGPIPTATLRPSSSAPTSTYTFASAPGAPPTFTPGSWVTYRYPHPPVGAPFVGHSTPGHLTRDTDRYSNGRSHNLISISEPAPA